MIDKTKTISMLDSLKNCELAVSELYRIFEISCKPENREFWRILSYQELQHSENVAKLMKLVEDTPDKFYPGRAFPEQVIKLIINGVKDHIDGVKKGRILDKQMYFIARDMEDSLIELRYKEVLRSELPAFKDICSTIDNETEKHKTMLLSKLAQIK